MMAWNHTSWLQLHFTDAGVVFDEKNILGSASKNT